MRDDTEELDWHLRHHRLGTVGPGQFSFDWQGLAARHLVLVPSYEQDARPIYNAVKQRLPAAQYFREGAPPTSVPDPDDVDFFVEIESAITSVADTSGELIYVNFYTEEAYLAVTAKAAEAVFGESAFDLVARSLARCVADGSLLMRRHRHGIRIFRDALQHLDTLWQVVPRPNSVML